VTSALSKAATGVSGESVILGAIAGIVDAVIGTPSGRAARAKLAAASIENAVASQSRS
jgi:uncharacterized membrane protein